MSEVNLELKFPLELVKLKLNIAAQVGALSSTVRLKFPLALAPAVKFPYETEELESEI
jgi:hypothetical protein